MNKKINVNNVVRNPFYKPTNKVLGSITVYKKNRDTYPEIPIHNLRIENSVSVFLGGQK